MKGLPHEAPHLPTGMPHLEEAPKAPHVGPEGAPKAPKAPPELADRGVHDEDDSMAANARALLNPMETREKTGGTELPLREFELKDFGAVEDAEGLAPTEKQQVLGDVNDVKSSLSELGKALLNRNPQAMREQAGKIASSISDSLGQLSSRIGEFLKKNLPEGTKTTFQALQKKAGELQQKVSDFVTKLKGMSPKDVFGAITKLRSDLSSGLSDLISGKNPLSGKGSAPVEVELQDMSSASKDDEDS